VCVAVASCRLPPLLARIRNSAQSQPTACTARPGSTPPQGSNKVQSLTRLPTFDRRPRPSLPTTGDCASLPWLLAHIEAPPPRSSLTSSLGDSSHRRHRTRASVAAVSTKTCACPRAASTPHAAQLSLFTSVSASSVATVLCLQPRHYCSSGMHLCRPCGINIGPLGHQLKCPSAFCSRHGNTEYVLYNPYPSPIATAGPLTCPHLHGI
jgi:hypothetical protein